MQAIVNMHSVKITIKGIDQPEMKILSSEDIFISKSIERRYVYFWTSYSVMLLNRMIGKDDINEKNNFCAMIRTCFQFKKTYFLYESVMKAQKTLGQFCACYNL